MILELALAFIIGFACLATSIVMLRKLKHDADPDAPVRRSTVTHHPSTAPRDWEEAGREARQDDYWSVDNPSPAMEEPARPQAQGQERRGLYGVLARIPGLAWLQTARRPEEDAGPNPPDHYDYAPVPASSSLYGAGGGGGYSKPG